MLKRSHLVEPYRKLWAEFECQVSCDALARANNWLCSLQKTNKQTNSCISRSIELFQVATKLSMVLQASQIQNFKFSNKDLCQICLGCNYISQHFGLPPKTRVKYIPGCNIWKALNACWYSRNVNWLRRFPWYTPLSQTRWNPTWWVILSSPVEFWPPWHLVVFLKLPGEFYSSLV